MGDPPKIPYILNPREATPNSYQNNHNYSAHLLHALPGVLSIPNIHIFLLALDNCQYFDISLMYPRFFVSSILMTHDPRIGPL